jgi:hypothetical protein
MTIQAKLDLTISGLKTKAMDLAYKYINLQKNGEDEGCSWQKLVVLTSKIAALEDFYCQNFDENGNITPTFTCASATLIKKYIDPNYQVPETGIEINIIDGGDA